MMTTLTKKEHCENGLLMKSIHTEFSENIYFHTHAWVGNHVKEGQKACN